MSKITVTGTDMERARRVQKAFGPCSACYECMSVEDVAEAIASDGGLLKFCSVQLSVEDITMDRMGISSLEFDGSMADMRRRLTEAFPELAGKLEVA